MYVYIYICMYVCMYVCIHIFICTYTYVQIYIYVLIYIYSDGSSWGVWVSSSAAKPLMPLLRYNKKNLMHKKKLVQGIVCVCVCVAC